jgi:hypothetical protein
MTNIKNVSIYTFVVFISFFLTAASAQIDRLCESTNSYDCYTHLISPIPTPREARMNDPFLFCTEGDPSANIMVPIDSFDTPANKIKKQPIAIYCPIMPPYICGRSKARVNIINNPLGIKMHRSPTNIKNRTLPDAQRPDGTVYSNGQMMCPCLDKVKLALWQSVCIDRVRGDWEGNQADRSRVPFPH